MSRRKAIRCGSPELHGRRWRVAEIDATGQRTHLYFTSEEHPDPERAAREYVAAFRLQTQEQSIGLAVNAYLEHLARYGGSKRRPLRESSLRTAKSLLFGILRLVDPTLRTSNRGRRTPLDLPMTDRPLSSLTPTAAQKLYSDRVALVSADTHRSELMRAYAFGAWCEQHGRIKANPFAEVLPEGTLSKGKEQLRIDEARTFALVAYADPHPLAGVAAAAVLTLGLRANELLDRVVRDLDDEGRVLWITKGKTDAARRRLAIPPVLRSALLKLAEGQAPDAYLFGSMTDGTLLKHVSRLCTTAGVPVVCTHGLRGTQISLTVEVGSLVEHASKGAGHADTGVTRSHYIAAGVEASARARLMEEILLREKTAEADAKELARLEAEAKAATERLTQMRARVGTSQGGYTTGSNVPSDHHKLTN